MGLTLPQYDSGCGWTVGLPYTSLVEAWKIRHLTRLARSSMLIAPCTLVLTVWTGSFW